MEQTGLKKWMRTSDHTTGNPWTLLLFFSLPLMAGNIFQQMYTVVDTAVVGKVLGIDALAALGAVDWLNWLTLGAIQGFTQGFSILMAQNFGAGQYEKLRRTMTNSLFLAVLCGVTLTIASEALAGPAVELLKVPAEIRPISMAYLRIMFGGLPVVMAYNLAASILRSLGNSRTPLIAMVIASLTNVALDLLFVMGFGWGVEGAAAATIIAQCLSAIYCVWHICHIEVLHISREDWDIRASLCGRLMMLGSPMAFQNTVIAIGGMITQTIVNGFDVPFIAGFTATNKLYGVLEVAATSYGYAMTTYTGQNLGARGRGGDPAGACGGVPLSGHHGGLPAGPVCAASDPQLHPGHGEHGAADGVRPGGVRDAHRRGADFAGDVRRERDTLCGDSGLGRCGYDSDSKLFLGDEQCAERN